MASTRTQYEDVAQSFIVPLAEPLDDGELAEKGCQRSFLGVVALVEVLTPLALIAVDEVEEALPYQRTEGLR